MNKLNGRPWLSQMGCNLVFMPPFARPIRRLRSVRPGIDPPDQFLNSQLDAHAGRCPVGLRIRCVDHHGILFAILGSQTRHHPGGGARTARSLPAVVERLVPAVCSRFVKTLQAIAIDEDDPTHTPIIGPMFALRLRNRGSRHALCASARQKRSDMFGAGFSNRESRSAPDINGTLP
jgi:hypothetical protein